MDSWRLTDKSVRNNAIEALLDVPLDGGITMTLKDSNSRSARQLALWWLLMRHLAKSGVGSRETADGYDLENKYRFTLPALTADDDFLADLWEGWRKMHPEPEAAEYFVKHHVHNSDMTVSQMADVLTSIYHYWGSHGVDLPDPAMYQYELSETDHD